MKVFVSVEMEGVTGITDPEDVLPDGADYDRSRVFMTGDATAAILGAVDAGASEVLVNDPHWTMRNLLLERLDPRARMIKGHERPMCMVQDWTRASTPPSSSAPLVRGHRACTRRSPRPGSATASPDPRGAQADAADDAVHGRLAG